ncbi:MAG: Ig family protein [Parcubacteria bacterium 32_520]|nr:MAG: Ig family protein [Parcubacteria bacterium 32_520]
MSKIKKNIQILCLLAINLFFLSSFVSADTNGFFFEYYRDQDLTEKIESGSKLKAGSYYIKIIQSGSSSLPTYISIDSEGINNDVSNHAIEDIGNGIFRYNRVINHDPLAIGHI